MNEPDPELRARFHARPFLEENECVGALEEIAARLSESMGDLNGQEPDEVLGAVTAWASLASYVVTRTYAPASPMRFAGWSRNVGQALTRLAAQLSQPLAWVAKQTGALDYSIYVSFPWGFTVGLSYPPAP